MPRQKLFFLYKDTIDFNIFNEALLFTLGGVEERTEHNGDRGSALSTKHRPESRALLPHVETHQLRLLQL